MGATLLGIRCKIKKVINEKPTRIVLQDKKQLDGIGLKK